ncbi:hypothetical protein V6K52_07740 [Knoellia sp. S7-12]|uniref:hypothetical protein n=1 Tax=Knoellia sp. S7-12 TaxID=3126698 RepID=UPI003367085E
MRTRRWALTTAMAIVSLGFLAGTPSASGAPTTPIPAASTSTSTPRIEPAATGIVGTVSPFRMYDSRAERPLAAGEVRMACVTGRRVPTEAAALVVNMTAVSPTRAGHLTAFSAGHDQPSVSNLNFSAGSTTSNLAVVELGVVGCISVKNASPGTTHVILDVQSFVMPGPATVAGTTKTIFPSRLLDTRARVTIPSHGAINVQIAGRGGVPSTGVGAAWLNFTATQTMAAGHLTVHAAGTSRPLTSNLNFGPADTRAALTLARLSATGAVTAYNASSRPIHLIVDAFGWTRSGDGARTLAGVVPVSPTRIWDTRIAGPLRRGETLTLDRSGRPEGASAAVLAVTATGASGAGHLTVSANNIAQNPTSAVNYVAGRATTNLVVARQDNDITVTNGGAAASVDVVVDLVGWVTGERAATGRVIDNVGRGISGAWVMPAPDDGGNARSGADGSYNLTLPLGRETVTPCARAGAFGEPDPAYADGCHPSWVHPTTFALALGERVAGTDIVLEPAGTVQGAATDYTGRPLTSAIVTLIRNSDKRQYDASVVSGQWNVPRVAAGEYYVQLGNPTSTTATPFGLAGEWYPDVQRANSIQPATLAAAGAKTISVAAGSATNINLEAEALAELRVKVASGTSAPLSTATRVNLYRANGTRFGIALPNFSTGIWSARVHPGTVLACAARSMTSTEYCWSGSVPLALATPITLTDGQSTTGIAITLP